MARQNRRRIATLLEIDFEPQKQESLEVRWIRQENQPLIEL
jgi:muramidase (phage lysozyme)